MLRRTDTIRVSEKSQSTSKMEQNQYRAGAARTQIPAWFERKFDFTFPVEQYPNLCVRLRGTPPRLEEMVRGISREVLLNKPEDNWSAQEHAGHLLDLEPLRIARVDDFLMDRDTLSVADLSNRKTHEANHNSRESFQAASSSEAAHATRGSFVLCCGARRPSLGKNLGDDRFRFQEGCVIALIEGGSGERRPAHIETQAKPGIGASADYEKLLPVAGMILRLEIDSKTGGKLSSFAFCEASANEAILLLAGRSKCKCGVRGGADGRCWRVASWSHRSDR
jgi:hypothetical protein